MNLQDKKKDIPEEFKQLAQDFSDNGFITTSLDNLVNSFYSQSKAPFFHS